MEAAAEPQPDPLAALLAATAAGDRAAFRRLYDATAPKLLGVALRLLHHRATAEDALQDADTSEQAAAAASVPVGTAKAWVRRGAERMRARLYA